MNNPIRLNNPMELQGKTGSLSSIDKHKLETMVSVLDLKNSLAQVWPRVSCLETVQTDPQFTGMSA